MNNIKKIAIAIKNADIDEVLFKACKKFNTVLYNIDELHLIHARNLNSWNKDFLASNYDFVKLDADYRENLSKQLLKKALDIFGNEYANKIKIYILDGSPIEEIMGLHAKTPLDLFFIGKKKKKRRSGRIAKEIGRRSNAPVLVVPENYNSNQELNKVIVPFDFSDLSVKALNVALDLKGDKRVNTVECCNIIDIPMYNSEIAISTHKFQQSLLSNARDSFNKKMKALHIKEEDKPFFHTQIMKSNSVAKDVIARTKSNSCGLIIMGAKGHSSIERFFLGSVAERMITLCQNTPILITR